MIGLCIAMARLVVPRDQARRAGVTASSVETAIRDQPDPQAREIARSVAWYVYQTNADNGISSQRLAQLVRRACEITERDLRP